jgi:Arc/MetJ-type ribon-helix-helix transcriptional regulator
MKKVKINVRIPENIHMWIQDNDFSVSDVVNEALQEFVLEKCTTNLQKKDIEFLDKLRNLKIDYIETAMDKNQRVNSYFKEIEEYRYNKYKNEIDKVPNYELIKNEYREQEHIKDECSKIRMKC